jgi:Pyridoxamine 5'-phosphate oxidase
MNELRVVAPAFAEMANGMVYCTLTTVDRKGRPRARIVHTLWEWDGERLLGWVGSLVTPMKTAHLRNNPYVSCNYWDGAEAYDTCVAECRAELLLDDESRRLRVFPGVFAKTGGAEGQILTWRAEG